MPYTLAGPRLKWDRAQAQVNALEAEIREFLQSVDKPYKFTLDRNTETGEDRIVINIVRQSPPMWSVQIGEIIHNLRSALDHMVYEIAATHGKGKVPTGTEFPIFIDEVRFHSTERGGGLYKIRGLPLNAQTSIEEIQPFQRKQAPTLHQLWALQELSNWDKHRLLHITNVATGARNLSLKPSPGIKIQSIKVRADGEIEDGAELACFKVTGISSGSGKVEVEGEIIFGVAFDKAGPGNGSLVAEGLRQLVEVVSKVGGRLRNLP